MIGILLVTHGNLAEELPAAALPIQPGLDKASFMRRLEETIEDATARLVGEATGRPPEPARLVLRSQGQTCPPESALLHISEKR